MLRRHNLLAPLLALCILASTGCQITPPEPLTDAEAERAVEAPTDIDAQALLRRAGAAEDPAEAGALYVQAARLLYADGEIAGSEDALARVAPEALDPHAAFEFHEITARLALDAGDPGRAARLLEQAIPASAEQNRAWLRLRARADTLRGRHGAAAEALMALGHLLLEREPEPDDAGRAELEALHDELWREVQRTPPHAIRDRAADSEGEVSRGWWGLAAALQEAFDLRDQRAALTGWRQRHEAHPAAIVPPATLRRLAAEQATPRRVALFLPLSGALANAGHAVRDGFMAGFYHADGEMTVSIHDSNAASMAELYEEALLEEAELIVGPLNREHLAELTARGRLAIPVLGLNTLGDGNTGSGALLQFSMAIEHEARALAQRLIEDGMERVLLFHAGERWSRRARLEFNAHFTRLGGRVLHDDFFAGPGDITPVVGKALLVEQSHERFQALAELLGRRPEFTPRRRRDVDAVVAFVGGTQARGLQPALAFHFAGELPVYTTSQALENVPAEAYRELDGMRFSQIPWRVYPSAIRTQINTHFPESRGELGGLYAFGLDAYRLADRIRRIFMEPDARLAGATGVLRLTDGGHITREPIWTIMRNGHLLALTGLGH